MTASATDSIIALDVGNKRIGVALAQGPVGIPRPLVTVDRENALEELAAIIQKYEGNILVIGLPRNLSGESTAQTKAVEAFGDELQTMTGLPVHWQDEAVTSKQAEAELQARRKPYRKEDIDALAATYILEDFLRSYRYSSREQEVAV